MFQEANKVTRWIEPNEDQGSLGENGQVSLSEHDLFGWLGWHVRKGWELLIEAFYGKGINK